jgi:hypothetical protein
MEPGKYSGRGTMAEFARASTDPVVAMVTRSCSINGYTFVVTDGDRADQRAYISLSIGWFRWINHHNSGLLALVATTEDEAARYTVALTLNPATMPTIIAD